MYKEDFSNERSDEVCSVGSESSKYPGEKANNDNIKSNIHDPSYFSSYADLEVHKAMLSDEPRMSFYGSILTNPLIMSGKTMIDVGCGTGVLSIWACKYGLARRVVSIEGCDEMAILASEIAKENGINVKLVMLSSIVDKTPNGSNEDYKADKGTSDTAEHAGEMTPPPTIEIDDSVKMIVIGGTTELLQKLFHTPESFRDTFLPRATNTLTKETSNTESAIGFPCHYHVDYIVSEWMGFYLFHECMLPSVITMRDYIHEVNRCCSSAEGEREGSAEESDDEALPPHLGGSPIMIPSTAELYTAPVSLKPYLDQKYNNFWVKGIGIGEPLKDSSSFSCPKGHISMSSVSNIQIRSLLGSLEATGAPLIDWINPVAPISSSSHMPPNLPLLHKPVRFASLDLQNMIESEALYCNGTALFDFGNTEEALREGIVTSDAYHVDGICVWFEVSFTFPSTTIDSETTPLTFTLNTGPMDPCTHWKQSTLLIPESLRGSDSLLLSTLANSGEKMVVDLAIQHCEGRLYTIEYSLGAPEDE